MTSREPIQQDRAAGQPGELRVLITLTLLGAVLRLHGLGSSSFWIDELITGTASFRPLDELLRFCSRDVHPPLYYLLVRAVGAISREDWFLRLPSAVAGILLIPVSWRLGRRLLGWREGLIVAALVTVSPFLIRYSQEARSYGLHVLLSTWGFVLLLEALERPRALPWTGFGAVTVTNLYLHYFAWLVLGIQVLVATWLLIARERDADASSKRRARWTGLLVSVGLAVLAYLPWIGAFWYFVQRNLGWVEDARLNVGPGARPDFDFARVIFALFTEGGLAPGGPSAVALSVALGLSVVGAVSMALRRPRAAAAILPWIAVPFLALFVARPRHTFEPRVLIFVVPFLLLVVARGAVETGGWFRRGLGRTSGGARWGDVAAASVAGIVLAGTVPHLDRLYATPKEDWRRAAAVVRRNLGPDEVVLVPAASYAFEFYAPDRVRRIRPADSVSQLREARNGRAGAWLIRSPYLRNVDVDGSIAGWLDEQGRAIWPIDDRLRVIYLRREEPATGYVEDEAGYRVPWRKARPGSAPVGAAALEDGPEGAGGSLARGTETAPSRSDEDRP